MPSFTLKTSIQHQLADTVTPVSIYLALRKRYPGTLLLESTDYRGSDNSFSYICVAPIATISLEDGFFTETLPDGSSRKSKASGRDAVRNALESFLGTFKSDTSTPRPSGVINGAFGYLNFDAIQFMEDISLKSPPVEAQKIPDLRYSIFRYIIAINHFKDEMYILENSVDGISLPKIPHPSLHLSEKPVEDSKFKVVGAEQSNRTDAEHAALIEKVKQHIFRGDVFQIVPSRKFSQAFDGDDFLVYRALRSLNPSPYLFYFDYGSYKIFGSSPEAQIVVKGGQAAIHPIAGTYKRTGNDEVDALATTKLLEDPKENAEHVMLVDLARNDLSIYCHPVAVEKYREVQFYSHVIHLVSKVTGTLLPGQSSIAIFTSTFPAGTLTGAPKYKAMELIDKYEGLRRHFYGGALGFLGFNGDIIHAIMIRSFLSKDSVLWSQAGSGVVADSVPETEVAEVGNKLGALKAAVLRAQELNR